MDDKPGERPTSVTELQECPNQGLPTIRASTPLLEPKLRVELVNDT